jgi:phospholipid-transporting ATPase
MLTGDKLETAENIARSCRLIQGDMTVMRFSETKESELRHKLVDNRMTYDLCIRENRKKSFLVEGEALGLIIGHKTMERDFVMMA